MSHLPEAARLREYFVFFLLQLLILKGFPSSLAAKEFTVNESSDLNDLEPGNGLCVAGLLIFPPFVFPLCTVRAAIEESNALPGPDVIHIQEGNYRLTLAGTQENMALTGDLDITEDLVIRGNGVEKTIIDGNSLDRVFDIPVENVSVTMKQLTVTNGVLPNRLPADQKGGGGIRNRGNLKLSGVVIASNRVRGSDVGDAGGGLYNESNCILTNSTFTGNRGSTGGGIHNAGGGSLSISASAIHDNIALAGGGLSNDGLATLINVTISGNHANSNSYPAGGGIHNTSHLEMLQSTIASNTSSGHGGGIYNEGDAVLTNTIVAGNSKPNCFPARPLLSRGNNLEDGDSCMLDTCRSDLINTDPELDPLQNHGGPTLTHGLLIGSPAVDRGRDLSSIGITEDQRGFPRPDGTLFDIGAFETRKRSIVPLFSHLLTLND